MNAIKSLPRNQEPGGSPSKVSGHPFFQTVSGSPSRSPSPGKLQFPNKNPVAENIDLIPREEALALGYNSLAIDYLKLGDLTSAVMYHAKHANVTQDLRSRAVALCNVGLVHRLANDIADSNECFMQALDIGKQTEDTVVEMLAYGHLGLNYAYACIPGTSSGDYWSKLAQCTEESKVAYPAELREHRSISPPSHEDIENAKDALYIFLRLQSSEDDPRNLSVAHSALGTLYHYEHRFTDAVHHFEQARDANETAEVPNSSPIDKCHIGIVSAHGYFKDYIKELSEKSRQTKGT